MALISLLPCEKSVTKQKYHYKNKITPQDYYIYDEASTRLVACHCPGHLKSC